MHDGRRHAAERGELGSLDQRHLRFAQIVFGTLALFHFPVELGGALHDAPLETVMLVELGPDQLPALVQVECCASDQHACQRGDQSEQGGIGTDRREICRDEQGPAVRFDVRRAQQVSAFPPLDRNLGRQGAGAREHGGGIGDRDPVIFSRREDAFPRVVGERPQRTVPP